MNESRGGTSGSLVGEVYKKVLGVNLHPLIFKNEGEMYVLTIRRTLSQNHLWSLFRHIDIEEIFRLDRRMYRWEDNSGLRQIDILSDP